MSSKFALVASTLFKAESGKPNSILPVLKSELANQCFCTGSFCAMEGLDDSDKRYFDHFLLVTRKDLPEPRLEQLAGFATLS